MEPLARALDILQGDKNLYIGYLLPTLVSLRNRLQSLKPGLKHAGPLVEALLTGIDHRIHGYSERYDLILASAPYPNWSFVGWMMPAKSIHAHCCTTMFVSWLNVVGLPAVNQMPTVKERNSFASVLMTENRDSKTRSWHVSVGPISKPWLILFENFPPF